MVLDRSSLDVLYRLVHYLSCPSLNVLKKIKRADQYGPNDNW